LGKNALLLTLALLPCPALAQRAQADLRCSYTGTDFVYDCVIRIEKNREPMPNLSVVVGADMPSMPMAHNVKPVKAKPGDAPGEYLARLDLEMAGEWAVKIRLSGALRDQLILHYEFDQRGARRVTRTGKSPRK
jgi:YtkA-like